jgi:hypothetical protein
VETSVVAYQYTLNKVFSIRFSKCLPQERERSELVRVRQR